MSKYVPWNAGLSMLGLSDLSLAVVYLAAGTRWCNHERAADWMEKVE